MYVFGVDIGGTGVKSGIVDEQGKIVVKSSIKTDRSRDYKAIIKDIGAQLIALAEEAKIPMSELSGVGIGCPGAIDSARGIVDYSCNLCWKNANVASELRKYVDLPVKISNDANVAALGETKFGAGKAYSDTVFVTLGTGVGGGVIIENKLFEGYRSKGAELGHMVIVKGGEPCACGRRGCMEAYASATALIRDTKRAMEKDKTSAMWDFVGGNLDAVDGRTSFECAKKGDKAAMEVVENYVKYLGEGVCNFINIFRPQAIILGGGVCAQGEYLLKPLREFVKANTYGGDTVPETEITVATLGNDAGLIGAASLMLGGGVETLL